MQNFCVSTLANVKVIPRNFIKYGPMDVEYMFYRHTNCTVYNVYYLTSSNSYCSESKATQDILCCGENRFPSRHFSWSVFTLS